MPIEVIDVDTLVSDQELDELLAGQLFTGNIGLAPDEWQQKAKPARQFALDKILEALRRRTPPINYTDLVYPQELRLGILYGAAAHVYQMAMSTNLGSDVFREQRELWMKEFEDFISSFAPTLPEGEVAASVRVFTVARR